MGKFVNAVSLFVVCFAVGFFFLKNKTLENSVNRDPAAIRGQFDISHLQGEKLSLAMKQRLMTGFEVQKTNEGANIGLGHFVFLDSSGQKKLACHEYGSVILTFEAEGVTVGGEKPEMQIEGRCESSLDMARINPLFLPTAKIIGEAPGDGEFQFNEGPGVTVRFANLPESWPKTWLLKGVQLKGESQSIPVVIESEEVARMLGHPVVLSW